jgi:hypothetical protein
MFQNTYYIIDWGFKARSASTSPRMIRGIKVMLDRDLAELYGVETKVLKQAVRRNIDRFPKDVMFELSKEDFKNLRSQFVTSSWGGLRYLPMVFSEQGVAMFTPLNAQLI